MHSHRRRLRAPGAAAPICLVLLAGLSGPTLAQQPSGSGDWKRGGVCYEIFVRSFQDSDGDGVGDLRGLIQKLDYVNDGDPDSTDDLGASCIWLMPVAESPSYHGYDVTDYYRIDRDYGTNDDFKLLVFEAHKRGIRVLVDLVLNHASSQHPWFKDALLRPDSRWRDWFIWSPVDLQDQSPWGSRIWHPSEVRDEYYYGLFWGGMPDLNYENPEVMAEAKAIATFWLEELGADGFRLDAVKHLVEEDGMVQHAPGTHDVLREFSAHVREVAPDAFTVGEVWDTIGAMLPYYPDQLDSHFTFETADAIIRAVNAGSADGLLAPYLRLQRELPADRWSPFLRNHDQPRTMTELGGDWDKAKLAATLLLTLPGLPFVYYGEEIGMTGDKPDPRIRTPMPWRREPGVGFTTGLAWEPLQPDSLTANVEAQADDPGSLLNLYRRLIHLRAADPALATGELIPLEASSDAVTAYLRREGERTVMVVANLGDRAVTQMTIASPDGALSPGRYEVRLLPGGSQTGTFTVTGEGAIEGTSLDPRQALILELTTAGP